MDLDILLLHLRSQLTPKWKEFGLAAGIAKGVLDSYSSYPPEECIVEVLDKWIRSHTVDKGTKATWKDVAVILKEIGLHQLAESILRSELETAQCIYTHVPVCRQSIHYCTVTMSLNNLCAYTYYVLLPFLQMGLQRR